MTRMVVPVSLLPRALVLASTQLGVWRKASSEIPAGVIVQVKSDPNCFNYSQAVHVAFDQRVVLS